jgi:hypothetical protein
MLPLTEFPTGWTFKQFGALALPNAPVRYVYLYESATDKWIALSPQKVQELEGFDLDTKYSMLSYSLPPSDDSYVLARASWWQGKMVDGVMPRVLLFEDRSILVQHSALSCVLNSKCIGFTPATEFKRMYGFLPAPLPE